MIDEQIFAAGMGVLADAFRYMMSDATIAVYYRILSMKLTNAEFEHAVQLVLEEERFWPSPSVLLEKIQRSAIVAGELALRHVEAVLSRSGGHLYVSVETFHHEFDLPTRRAISACDGLARITNTPHEHRQRLERRFADAYAKALRPQAALAPPPLEEHVRQLLDTVTQSMPCTPTGAPWRTGKRNRSRRDER